MNWNVVYFLLFICFNQRAAVGSRVLELSDRFLDVRHDGQWFIKFYAPWCAYCKKMEPVWSQVAQALHNTNIRVAKVDCTRFTAVAKSFNIQSYPTILYVKDNKEYVFHGDRTKDDLLQFVIRMSGPPVQRVTLVDSVELLKENNPIFFMFVGAQENENVLWNSYSQVAEAYQPHAAFYATNMEIAKIHFTIDTNPTIIAYKEKSHIHFPLAAYYDNVTVDYLNNTLHKWINEERFPVFPKVTRSNIHELMTTRKFLVLVIVEENRLLDVATHEIEFRDMVAAMAKNMDWRLRNYFQYGWIGSPDLAHSIAMDYLATPHLLVLNCTTNEHHIPDDDPMQMTVESIQIFLENVYNSSVKAYGGNAFHVRLYRSYFETRRSLIDMWRGNPILTAVLFGLPLGFLSLIVYSICCADIMDADESELEENHEKRE